MDNEVTERRIRALGCGIGLTSLTAIARAAGIQPSTLVDNVRGYRRPSANTVTKLANALGVSTAELGLILAEAHSDR